MEFVDGDVVPAARKRAFAFFGGTTQTIRLDNLKEAFSSPTFTTRRLNPLYAKMLGHYGVCRSPAGCMHRI